MKTNHYAKRSLMCMMKRCPTMCRFIWWIRTIGYLL